jgi:NAD(P)H-flavin reductase
MADETSYASARVVESWDETQTLRALRLDLGHERGSVYAVPGQVVKVRTPAGEGYFALASPPPSDGTIELLVKRGGAAADHLIAAQPGSALEVSAPFGKGFPVAEAKDRDVLVFAVGSGIAPVRALVRHLTASKNGTKLALFYGQRDSADFAYTREHGGWRDAGVILALCASKPTDGWSGARGWVQDVAAQGNFAGVDLSRAIAFLCGHKAMVSGVRETLERAGVPKERTFLNY